MRASARSSVDLPHALGPTIAVNEPVRDRDVEPLGDDALVVGERQVVAVQARLAHPLPLRHSRVSSQVR